MSQFSDDDQQQAKVARSLADSLADYAPPPNGELRLPDFDEFELETDSRQGDHSAAVQPDTHASSTHAPVQTALPIDNPVPPVQEAFDGWSTSYEQVDSGIKAEPDEFRVRPQPASDIESSFDITRVFSQTGSKIQRQSKEWGSATVAVFAARKEQHNLIWLGIAGLIAIVALVWLFKPSDTLEPQEHLVTIAPPAPNPELLTPPATTEPQAVVTAPPPVVTETTAPAVASSAASAPTVSRVNQASVTQPVVAKPAAKAVDVYQPAENIAKPVTKPAAAAKPVAGKGGYTVQIAAAHNEANIKALAAKLPRPAEAQIVRSWRDGKPWYVLSYGHYKNHDEATRARNALPQAIKTGNAPWVKEL